MTDLRASHYTTLRYINERPGKVSVTSVGADYAAALQGAGLIVVKNGKCRPTAAGAAYGVGRSPEQRAEDLAAARATLIGRWATAR